MFDDKPEQVKAEGLPYPWMCHFELTATTLAFYRATPFYLTDPITYPEYVATVPKPMIRMAPPIMPISASTDGKDKIPSEMVSAIMIIEHCLYKEREHISHTAFQHTERFQQGSEHTTISGFCI